MEFVGATGRHNIQFRLQGVINTNSLPHPFSIRWAFLAHSMKLLVYLELCKFQRNHRSDEPKWQIRQGPPRHHPLFGWSAAILYLEMKASFSFPPTEIPLSACFGWKLKRNYYNLYLHFAGRTLQQGVVQGHEWRWERARPRPPPAQLLLKVFGFWATKVTAQYGEMYAVYVQFRAQFMPQTSW